MTGRNHPVLSAWYDGAGYSFRGGPLSRSEIRAFLENLKTRFLETPGVIAVERAISNKMDDVIRELWQRGGRHSDGFVLFAVGGYGRETVHPESDIDLLFYFKEQIDEETIKIILHPLWD